MQVAVKQAKLSRHPRRGCSNDQGTPIVKRRNEVMYERKRWRQDIALRPKPPPCCLGRGRLHIAQFAWQHYIL